MNEIPWNSSRHAIGKKLKSVPLPKKRRHGVVRSMGEVFVRTWWICFKALLCLLILFLLSVGFVKGYRYLLGSPYLRLERIEIRGVEEALRNELLEISGLARETSLVALNLDRVKILLEGHPWVKRVQVERHFPHALIIDVEEEKPVAIAVQGETLIYVNAGGDLFKQVAEADSVDFPMITGVAGGGLEQQGQLQKACRVLNALENEEGQWSLENLSEIHLDTGGTVSLYFSELRAEIRMSSDNIQERLEGLRRVTRHLAETGQIGRVAYIDLNYMDGIVIRFRKA